MDSRHVLFVGMGGLGCPAARALAKAAGPRLRVTVLDDDTVDETNLHRQILFSEADVARPKAEVAAARLRELGAREVRHLRARFEPSSARELLGGVDLVIEGADNFATKFLVADACAMERVPVVHGGAVGWNGWALASDPRALPHAPCLRCVFEDVPGGEVPTCADVGVLGAVVGVLGALQAKLAHALLFGGAPTPLARVHHYRALEGRLRTANVRPRAGCPLASPQELELLPERYAPSCAT
jgi:adenylyltransferase/sulfurtransferase